MLQIYIIHIQNRNFTTIFNIDIITLILFIYIVVLPLTEGNNYVIDYGYTYNYNIII